MSLTAEQKKLILISFLYDGMRRYSGALPRRQKVPIRDAM